MIAPTELASMLEGSGPAGPDLAYDADFMALETLLQGRPERQIGDTIVAGEPPDWKRVFDIAHSLAQRTRDLRIACCLTRALTRLEGLAGMAAGLQLCLLLCEQLWQDVHPQLDDSDGDDPTMRMNALAPLADGAGLLRDLRDSELVSVRGMGSCTVRDYEVAARLLPAPADGLREWPSLDDIGAIIAMASRQGVFAPGDAAAALALARSLQQVLNERVGADQSTDLQPLIQRLAPLAGFLQSFAAADEAAGSAPSEAPAGPADMALPAARPAHGGSLIGSRDDANRMLELVCRYFEQHEPANPAPLLIRRAQRLSAMNFLDIVRDLAPEALGTVENIAGRPPEE